MRLLRVLLSVVLIGALQTPLVAQPEEPRAYFSITTERTYMPGEKIEAGVYSNNVAELEFRVYRVNDAAKFFSQLQDLHSFGGQAPRLPRQEKGWLERFHAWKHRIWAWIRDFIRAQFSEDSRHKIRLWRMGESETPKKGPQATEFAQVPVLNQQQLVTSWKWAVPKGERWQSQRVEIPVKDRGVYLVEATNGTLRAYTIVVVTDIAVITKAASGRLLCFVVNRTTGNPIAGAPTRVWIEQQEIANKPTDQQGILDLPITQAKPENVAVLATYQDQVAVNAPGAWNMGSESRNLRGYTYTDRPVYRPGDTVHFKTIVRTETPGGYVIPQERELSLELRDPRTYQQVWQQTVALSDIGVAHWDYTIPADANLGFYYPNMKSGERYVEGVRFSVQDYKKPEYAVKVTAQTPRVLQGQPIKATIDARYYFGEPVANAKVKWVVHTSTYWPFGRYESDSDAGGDEYDAGDNSGDEGDTYGGDQESEQGGVLDADGKLQITIPTKANAKKQDLIYRIEARVTDEGNREISGRGFALATYGSFYLTAQPSSYVYSKGSTAVIDVTARDYDKKPVATAFRAELTNWNWKTRSGSAFSTTQGQTGGDGKGQVQFTIPDAGEYRVRVTAMSAQSREVEDAAFLWAPGESPLWAGTQQERIQIVPDKKSYV
ncbi:MAG TPA: MG2 domain-containing protein, partial [Candidatus Angelobacter sp.]|nr:MG2 domain-containing protein [Candidatus Angelobacter sp.]